MSKANNKKKLGLEIALAVIAIVIPMIIVGKYTSTLSRIGYVLNESWYEEVYENGAVCDIGYYYSKHDELKKVGVGWPVIQSAVLDESNGIPSCVGKIKLLSFEARIINNSLLIVGAGTLIVLALQLFKKK